MTWNRFQSLFPYSASFYTDVNYLSIANRTQTHTAEVLAGDVTCSNHQPG